VEKKKDFKKKKRSKDERAPSEGPAPNPDECGRVRVFKDGGAREGGLSDQNRYRCRGKKKSAVLRKETGCYFHKLAVVNPGKTVKEC